MYSLEEIFQQAVEDKNCADLNYPNYTARISWGLKIVKDDKTKEINIFNTTKRGDYYEEISHLEYENFKENGWLKGIYLLSLSNFRRKLNLIEGRIQSEVNNKGNLKVITGFKNARERIMKRYTKVSNKLKELNNG
jgi:hypothetical protein